MYKPPVAFFGFNRPDCTKVVFEEIRRYRPEKLLLVADGPRATVPTDQARCEEVRRIMQSVDWECQVLTNFSEANLGCKRRMSSGMDWVFSQVEEAILLEDDCVPGEDFFRFCAEMLERYRDNPQVVHVGGTNVQGGRVRGDGSYYFSRYFHIWGWASWRRAWKNYDVAISAWPKDKQDKWLSQALPSALACEYTTRSFDLVHAGGIDTWDYQWTYACLKHLGLGITPNMNLVSNIGAGPDATHTKGPAGSLEMPRGRLGELRHPSRVEQDRVADQYTFLEHGGGNELLQRQRDERRQKSILQRASRKLMRMVRGG